MHSCNQEDLMSPIFIIMLYLDIYKCHALTIWLPVTHQPSSHYLNKNLMYVHVNQMWWGHCSDAKEIERWGKDELIVTNILMATFNNNNITPYFPDTTELMVRDLNHKLSKSFYAVMHDRWKTFCDRRRICRFWQSQPTLQKHKMMEKNVPHPTS